MFMFKKYSPTQICLVVCVLVGILGTTWSQDGDDIVVTTQRLSDRVLVLSETLMGNNVVAINAEKGIVVIDNTGLPSTAAKMRRMIEETFKRTDFAYMINTHYHWDHSFGNQVFADAIIIGHENVPAGMARDKAIMPQRIASLEQRLKSETERFKSAEVNPEETPNAKVFFASLKRQIHDFKNVFEYLSQRLPILLLPTSWLWI
jgi:glyoxylase-like metal-dependent hydrolase (beta-lactamase superfamily II)